MLEENKLYNAFINADSVVMKKYLSTLSTNPICDLPETIKGITAGSNFQLSKVTKIVYDKDENILDKLTTAYNTVSSYKDCSIITIIHSNRIFVDLYVGIACRELDEKFQCNTGLRGKQNTTLKSALLGNFPGTELKDIFIEGNEYNKAFENNNNVIDKVFENIISVSSVSGIAALRNGKQSKNNEYIQGVEKLIDSMRGEKYSAIFIADSISVNEIEEICMSYEDLYSQLSPFEKSVKTLNTSDSSTDTKGIIKGIADTTNDSISRSLSYGVTKGTSKTHTGGGNVGGSIGSKTFGATVGGTYNYSKGKSENTINMKADTKTAGTAKSLTEQNSVAKALTTSSGESLQLTYENKAVTTLLERIDQQIKRLRSCEDFGIFDFGAYFLAEDTPTAISAANTYQSLMRGEDSSVEASAVNTWESAAAKGILEYLRKMYHPLIAISNNLQQDKFHSVTPTSLVSGKELPIHMGLPKKSVSGIPIIECAEFGRDVVSYDQKYQGNLEIGCIYHMHQEEEEKRIALQSESLPAHVFVTGSTGSGKSNTIYKILDEATKCKDSDGNDVKFLVIEPAKGEYKNVFGHREDVSVYGTNPNISEMLRINPFKFPKEIHVLEHLDRLIEIFNVCWPMYAAMPAVLKDSIERAYMGAGWDLRRSINQYHDNLFPDFTDVLAQIHIVINESEYSADNKGDYIGALATRVKSLTNGINGMIFVQDDLTDDELFDENVIVDLSRVGSTETKAFIMGLLVMKLQEYRMSSNIPNNSKLRHITVLEEAHNLLKRTSTEQSTEGSNLLGKSVEMLSNAIAEMRTYGESFIIADQSPGLLDMSVIRNTNTKIILRLPDFSDRELVGKSAGLNDDQIIELSKLQRGVAAIYQNDWINPVLCKVDYYETQEIPYTKRSEYNFEDSLVEETVLELILNLRIREGKDTVDYEEFKNKLIKSSLKTGLKIQLMEYMLYDGRDKLEVLQRLAYEFFNAEQVLESAKSMEDIESWKSLVIDEMNPTLKGYAQHQINWVIALILQEQVLRDSAYKNTMLRYMETLEIQKSKGMI